MALNSFELSLRVAFELQISASSHANVKFSQIVEIMKSICFACLQISAHLDLESKKSNESIPLLSSLVGDITRAVEDTSRYIPYDTLIAILDGLKRRAIGSINPDFFAMAVTAEFASALLHHELMETWLNNTFTFNTELSREEIVGCRCVRDLFIMVLERATSPDEVHTLPAILTAVVPDVEGEIVGIGEECTGITSNSIITGFKSFPMDSIKGSDDVSYEERQNIDGTIVSTLRAVECQRKRSRGSICEACRLAQNRWAVRICRQKKAKPDANGAAIAQ